MTTRKSDGYKSAIQVVKKLKMSAVGSTFNSVRID